MPDRSPSDSAFHSATLFLPPLPKRSIHSAAASACCRLVVLRWSAMSSAVGDSMPQTSHQAATASCLSCLGLSGPLVELTVIDSGRSLACANRAASSSMPALSPFTPSYNENLGHSACTWDD